MTDDAMPPPPTEAEGLELIDAWLDGTLSNEETERLGRIADAQSVVADAWAR